MTLSINLYLGDSNPKPYSFVHKVLSQCHLQQSAEKVIYFVWLCILSYNLFIRINALLISKKNFCTEIFLHMCVINFSSQLLLECKKKIKKKNPPQS